MLKNQKYRAAPPIIGCLVIQLCVGIIYLWSAFSKNFVAAYGWTDAAAKMVASYMLFAFVAGNLSGGLLGDRAGPKLTAIIGVSLQSLGIAATAYAANIDVRLTYLTYSVFGGLGSGIAYSACISCVQKWLPHRRGLASGLAVSAFGLSNLAFAPLATWLSGHFGISYLDRENPFSSYLQGFTNFKPVFLILAGVFFAAGIIACIFVKLPDGKYLAALPEAPPKTAPSKRDYTLSQAAKTVPFWTLFAYIFFINGTWNLISPIIKPLAEVRAPAYALFALSFVGIPNTAGRLIMAAISDRIGRVPASLFLCGLTLAGAALMTFAVGVPFIIVLFAIAFGYGGPSAINAAISTDFFGAKHSGANYGIIMTGLGFSSVAFNALSNRFLHSDAQTFAMGAVTAALAAVCMIVIAAKRKVLTTENK
ncbi:MAG: MFS transporter [Oscillospiraceae bacterium]|jgi:OFA family oxalate/formate antiporter-like MFS transporter|nr:MFS transporter [Oscillospiraceae bacterium]